MCACCMFLPVCTPVYVGVLTYACAHEGQKLMFCVLSFPLIFWDMVSHWAWSSPLQLEWLASEQQRSVSPSTKGWDTDTCCGSWLLSEGLGSKLRCPHSCGECSGHCAISHHSGPNPKQNCSFTLCPRTFAWPFQVSVPYLPSRDSVNYIMPLQWWTEMQ